MGIRIDALDAVAGISGADQIPAMRSGQTIKLTADQIATFVIALVTDSAPATLDTLNELAAALGDDPNFATTVTNSLATKASLTGTETLTNKTLMAPVLNAPQGELLRGYISPAANLANGADAANDINFPTCYVASSAAVPILMSHTAATAELDAAFGTGNGGRFDTSISDGTWHCYIISNGTTVSRGFSKSLNPSGQANYPSGYTHYRRVGSIIRVSSAILPFIQDGDEWTLATPIADITAVNPGGSAVSRTLTVPTGISVIARIVAHLNVGTGGATFQAYFSSLDTADIIPSSVDQLRITTPAGSTTWRQSVSLSIKTNTSGQIRSRLSVSDVNTSLNINTFGWRDTRGRV